MGIAIMLRESTPNLLQAARVAAVERLSASDTRRVLVFEPHSGLNTFTNYFQSVMKRQYIQARSCFSGRLHMISFFLLLACPQSLLANVDDEVKGGQKYNLGRRSLRDVIRIRVRLRPYCIDPVTTPIPPV